MEGMTIANKCASKGVDEKHVVRGNRIKTDPYLKLEGYENIFSIGDIAAIISEDTPKGHPQVAQPAIQQGEISW